MNLSPFYSSDHLFNVVMLLSSSMTTQLKAACIRSISRFGSDFGHCLAVSPKFNSLCLSLLPVKKVLKL